VTSHMSGILLGAWTRIWP